VNEKHQKNDSASVGAVSGLVYLDDFIPPSYEAELIACIDQQHDAWMTELSRRVQHYGYRYHYGRPHVHLNEQDHLGSLPEWLSSLAYRLTSVVLLLQSPDQAIINEYMPGQGISKHVDCPGCFGPRIATVSLGSACVMFLRRQQFQRIQFLQRRSALVLTGDSRSHWTHEIPARKNDEVNGVGLPRGRRLSVTFRAVNLSASSR
jgi:alkylated DNA repair dioxygenase AlkB